MGGADGEMRSAKIWTPKSAIFKIGTYDYHV